MSKSVKQLTPVVIMLKSLKPEQRKEIVGHLSKEHMQGITGMDLNIVKNSVQLTPEEINAYRVWKKPLKLLALKRYPAKEKKKILQSSGFFEAIVPVSASVLGAVLNG